MTLRFKTLLVVGLALAVLIGTLIGVSHLIVMGGFARLEAEQTRLHHERLRTRLAETFTRLQATAGDWGPWNETYSFIETRDPEFVRSNLNDETIANLRINFMAFFDLSGDLAAAKAVDLETGTETRLADDLRERLGAVQTLANASGQKMAGYLMVGGQPVSIAAHPILDSNHHGPSRGVLILGRFLDAVEINALSRTHHAAVTVQPARVWEAMDDSGQSHPMHLASVDDNRITCNSLEKDVFGTPAFVLSMSTSRSIYRQGLATWWYYSALLGGIGLVFVGLIMAFLEKTVLAPLGRLSRNVNAIGRKQDFTVRLDTAGRDELGVLSFEINQMLEQLDMARRQLLDQSHALGRAEMAAKVLHQVRNALMPITGYMSLLADELRALPLAGMEKAIAELDAGQADPQRQQDLNRFLKLAGRMLIVEVNKAKGHLEHTRQPIANLENILADYQNETRNRPAAESEGQ